MRSPSDLRIDRSLPHGHVAAVLGMAKKAGLYRLLPESPARLAKLALAMIVVPAIGTDVQRDLRGREFVGGKKIWAGV